MVKTLSYWRIIVCAFSLTLILPAVSFSGTLREEAVSYRQEGFEKQKQGDWQAALSLYQKASELDPSYPTPYNDTGVLLEQQGRLEEARRAYEKAIELDPNYPDAHANLAMLYERLGDKNQAIIHWTKRYEVGDEDDSWTLRAQERLIALGALQDNPSLKGKLYSRRRVVEEERNKQKKSLNDFHAVTSDWQK